MLSLILSLTSRGFGVRESIAVASSHSQWAFLYLMEEETYGII